MSRVLMLSFNLMIFAALLARVSTAAAPASVSLTWDASPDTNVVGYALYYGLLESGYTARMDVQQQQSAVVTNLSEGMTYIFVVTAYTADGVESLPSNEISYLVPGAVRFEFMTRPDLAVLRFPGQAGEVIVLEASEDLRDWFTLFKLHPQANGLVNIVDAESAYHARRFYRLVGDNVGGRRLELQRLPGGPMGKLSFVRPAGERIKVEASEDLKHWTELYRVESFKNAWIELVDPDSARLPCRFYRVTPLN